MDRITKICSRCKEEKELEEFGTDNSRKDGKSYFCIECWNEKGRKNVKKFRIKRVAQNKEWSLTESGQNSIKESRKRCRAQKRQSDPAFFIFETQRTRIKTILKQQGLQKTSRTHELLGCDLDHFKQHLESQFVDGMTWKNRGKENGWHIDHIIPGDHFDLTNFEQQRICFNYRNLQPLSKFDNLSKHNKLPENYLSLLETIKSHLNDTNTLPIM